VEILQNLSPTHDNEHGLYTWKAEALHYLPVLGFPRDHELMLSYAMPQCNGNGADVPSGRL
jgi:hypothetical protein